MENKNVKNAHGLNSVALMEISYLNIGM